MPNAVKYWCKLCDQPTAEKQDDLMGWDGYCSNCGLIAQASVGERVKDGSHTQCEQCGAPATHRVGGLNLCDKHDFRKAQA